MDIRVRRRGGNGRLTCIRAGACAEGPQRFDPYDGRVVVERGGYRGVGNRGSAAARRRAHRQTPHLRVGVA